MKRNNRPRGATPIREDSAVAAQHHKHLLVVAALSACVAIAASLAPGGKVEANRQAPSEAETVVGADRTEDTADRIIAATDNTPTGNPSTAQATATPAAAPLPTSAPADGWIAQTVRPGDNLSLIFNRAGFDNGDVHELVYGAEQGKQLARIYPGQTIAFRTSDAGELLGVRHVLSPLETITYLRDSEGQYLTERMVREPEVREARSSGEITSSLFMAGQDMGLSHTKIIELASIFGGVIDFVLDPRKGDTIHVVYEELYLDGEKYGDGNILAAAFTNRGKTYAAYRYEDGHGDVGFYSADGVSMRKAFLLAPVDFTRISSNFNLRRLHPIYKTTRPHRGTDYAAPTGTPVYAAGDGRVTRAGYTRANGNYVFIQHGDRYETKYLHLHKRHVKQGQRVTQNDVIGTVGATGAATGPHLHYEFLMDGVHRNPRTVHKELPKAKELPASELASFRQAIAPAEQQLAMLQSGSRLAFNESGGDRNQP